MSSFNKKVKRKNGYKILSELEFKVPIRRRPFNEDVDIRKKVVDKLMEAFEKKRKVETYKNRLVKVLMANINDNFITLEKAKDIQHYCSYILKNMKEDRKKENSNYFNYLYDTIDKFNDDKFKIKNQNCDVNVLPQINYLFSTLNHCFNNTTEDQETINNKKNEILKKYIDKSGIINYDYINNKLREIVSKEMNLYLPEKHRKVIHQMKAINRDVKRKYDALAKDLSKELISKNKYGFNNKKYLDTDSDSESYINNNNKSKMNKTYSTFYKSRPNSQFKCKTIKKKNTKISANNNNTNTNNNNDDDFLDDYEYWKAKLMNFDSILLFYLF